MVNIFLMFVGFSTPLKAAELQPTEAEALRTSLYVSFEDHMAGKHKRHDGGTCLTGLVQQLKENWDLFSDVEQSEMTAALAPWKTDLVAPTVVTNPPPPNAEPASCWGQQLDNYLDTEHFSIQWDDDTIDQNTAQSFADSLEYSWDIEIDELGWRQPAGYGEYKTLIRVERMGNYAGAYTTVERCDGRYRSYVVASHNSFRAGNWYKTMACHELHHAIQYAYGSAHEFWWWEATSTWVEDLVYPGLNHWADALSFYSQNPEMGMNAWAGNSNDNDLFYHTYSMGIWGKFLDEHVGGNELMKDTWQKSVGWGCQYCAWMPEVIESTGEDFDEVYTEFLANNVVMDYRDSRMLETPDLSERITSVPAEGEDRSSDRPQSLGANFILFTTDVGGEGDALEVSFAGDTNADEWFALLVRGDETVEEMVVFELDSNHEGEASIELDGVNPVHLVVSPASKDAQGYTYSWSNADEFGYVWSAGLEGDQVDVVDQTRIVGDEEKSLTACGCAATTGLHSGGWLALLGLLIGFRRRETIC